MLFKYTFQSFRSHLEYASSVWNPHSKKSTDGLEKVERRAIKLVQPVQPLKYLIYEDIFRKLKLDTLKYRTTSGDLIAVFKIIANKENNSRIMLTTHKRLVTRGHSYKLYQKQVEYDLMNYFFTNRIIPLWNCLPYQVVSSGSVNVFKNIIGKGCHWNRRENECVNDVNIENV